jgi:small GTP-binding protein
MTSHRLISRKLILLGGFAVGKTSLTNRFVHQKFSNEYIATLGVNIEKKEVALADISVVVNLIIWDIADITLGNAIPESYFAGAHGVIWVFDLSRQATWSGLKEQMEDFAVRLPGVPALLAGNKLDLVRDADLPGSLREAGLQPDLLTSAKSGEGVENLFMLMARKMAR